MKLKDFKDLPVGSSFGIDIPPNGGHLYVKIQDGRWHGFEITWSKWMEFDVYKDFSDEQVYATVVGGTGVKENNWNLL